MSLFEKVFMPIKIKGLAIPNRIVFPAVDNDYATDDGFVTERYLRFHSNIAKGGAGLSIVGASAVTENGRGFPNLLNLYDDKFIGGLSKLFSAIKENGSVPAIQLSHAGRQTLGAKFELVAPSPISATLKWGNFTAELEKPRELNENEVVEIEDAFADAAVRVKKAGAELVEIHGCHGYLIQQFLSPFSNKRTDKYGGTLENRVRFFKNIVTKTREKVGNGFPICCRISAEEYVGGGLTLKDSMEIAPMLVNAGADAISVSAGRYESSEYSSPPIELGECVHVHLAEAIKECVDVPVICVGSILDLASAEKILEEGRADLVAMGRAQIADPQIVKKSKRGDFEYIKKCTRCSGCLFSLFTELGLCCPINKDLPRLTGEEPRIRV
jgi:2,4-dienoyl-CoA reductase-like NADH-dependent reductase (Old Yellow Enzyme family)